MVYSKRQSNEWVFSDKPEDWQTSKAVKSHRKSHKKEAMKKKYTKVKPGRLRDL